MMVDAPGYDYDYNADNETFDLTQNKDTNKVMNFINNMM